MSKFKLIVAAAFFIAGCSRGQANDEQKPAPPPPSGPSKVEPVPPPDEPTAPTTGNPPANVKPVSPAPEVKSGDKNKPLVIQPPMEVVPGDKKSEAKPETKPATTPEMKAESKPEVKPDTKLDAKTETKPKLEPLVKPDQQKVADSGTKPDAPAGKDALATPGVEAPSAGNIEKIRSALKTDDRASEYFASALVESDLARVADLARQYAGAVLEDPDTAAAKVAKTQMAVRDLADADLYDQATAKRVAYVQSVLDQRVQDNRDGVVLRDGIFIVATSAVIGAAAGFRPVTRLVRTIEDGGAASARAVAAETAQVEQQGLVAAAEALFESKTLAEVGDLGLVQLRKGISELPVDQFRPSSVPGIRWTLLDNFEGESLGDSRVLVLNWNPFNKQGSFVSSRVLNPEEAKTVERQLETAALDPVRPAGEAVREEIETTRRFQIGRALKYGLGSIIPFGGFYSRGYTQGWHSGAQDHLYLESLVPPDKLRKAEGK